MRLILQAGRLLIGILLIWVMADSGDTAYAAPKGGVASTRDGVAAKASGSHAKPGRASQPGTGSSEAKSTRGDSARQQKAWQAKVQHVIDYNNKVTKAQQACVERAAAQGAGCTAPKLITLEGQPNIAAEGAAPAAPAVTPQQAAYIAFARLRLTAPKPMVGPPPSINEWKMAAVGYPMWLWAEGNLDPAPVSDSVYDISVALDARLVKIVYDMGDGHKVTCTNVSRKWTSDITPGTSSPVCGYAYQKPSLPKGKYTITANAVWAVDWTVNGTSGTIPFYQSASTQLPVGELQVLVR